MPGTNWGYITQLFVRSNVTLMNPSLHFDNNVSKTRRCLMCKLIGMNK